MKTTEAPQLREKLFLERIRTKLTEDHAATMKVAKKEALKLRMQSALIALAILFCIFIVVSEFRGAIAGGNSRIPILAGICGILVLVLPSGIQDRERKRNSIKKSVRAASASLEAFDDRLGDLIIFFFGSDPAILQRMTFSQVKQEVRQQLSAYAQLIRSCDGSRQTLMDMAACAMYFEIIGRAGAAPLDIYTDLLLDIDAE